MKKYYFDVEYETHYESDYGCDGPYTGFTEENHTGHTFKLTTDKLETSHLLFYRDQER